MQSKIAILLCLLLWCSVQINCDSEETLIGRQSIVPTVDSSEPIREDAAAAASPQVKFSNWTTMSEALDLFSARNLARNWIEGKYHLNQECERDITRYIDGLKRQEIWALKSKFSSFYMSIVLLAYK